MTGPAGQFDLAAGGLRDLAGLARCEPGGRQELERDLRRGGGGVGRRAAKRSAELSRKRSAEVSRGWSAVPPVLPWAGRPAYTVAQPPDAIGSMTSQPPTR